MRMGGGKEHFRDGDGEWGTVKSLNGVEGKRENRVLSLSCKLVTRSEKG